MNQTADQLFIKLTIKPAQHSLLLLRSTDPTTSRALSLRVVLALTITYIFVPLVPFLALDAA